MLKMFLNVPKADMDNNAGVFHRLIDEAEEEDCKETILAYYFLLAEGNMSDTGRLDEAVECWFSERWRCEVNFEVEDALAKLTDLGLVEGRGGGLQVPPVGRACAILDSRWDHYCAYAAAGTPQGEGGINGDR